MKADPVVTKDAVVHEDLHHDVTLGEVWIRYKDLGWHFYLAKGIFVVAIVSGLYSLFEGIKTVFVVIPQLPDYFKIINYSEHIYAQLLEEVVIISAAGFAESAFGAFMLVKPYRLVENFQILITVALIGLSFYLRSTGQLLDIETINKTLEMARHPGLNIL